MKINIFAGARRIAVLLATFVTAISLAKLGLEPVYLPASISIARPGAAPELSDACPRDASQRYVEYRLKSGREVALTLCLLAMDFGGRRLIPHSIDAAGMMHGAPAYSSEITAYEKRLTASFSLTPEQDARLEREFESRRREKWVSGLGYLAAALVALAVFVWATGWVVRGFLGIASGRDSRDE